MNILYAGVNTGASKAVYNAYNASSRFRFSEEQLTLLKQTFQLNPYPHVTQINRLATALNVDVEIVQNWFHHKRDRSKHLGEFQCS